MRFVREWGFAFKSMQNYAFDQITKGQLGIFGQRLEDFKQGGFDPNPCLGTGYDFSGHGGGLKLISVTMLPR